MEKPLNHSWNSSQYSKTSDLQAAVADELIENLQIKPDENVLDLGCGIGNITMHIASIANRGRVLGIDASSSMINQARKNLSLSDINNISFQVMPASELNFNKEFDVVSSNSVFHWIKNQEKMLKAIHRALKPRGRLGVQFPLLNESHPMMCLVNEAISRLKLNLKYNNPEFPWFVPETGDEYAVLLNRFEYKDVTVREVKTEYIFESSLTVMNFFKSVGLELLLKPLSSEEKKLLESELGNLIEKQKSVNGIRFGFRRLYAYANLL